MLFQIWCELASQLKLARTHREKQALIQTVLKAHPKDALRTLHFLLIREQDKRVFRLGARQLCKVVASLYDIELNALRVDLEKIGDVAATIQRFVIAHADDPLPERSTWHLQDVDREVFGQLVLQGTLEHQKAVLKRIVQHCTAFELYWLIKLVQKDLRLGAGAKIVLGAVHPDAYAQWQLTHDLKMTLHPKAPSATTTTASSNPIQPMLCRVTKSFDDALKRCPNGMLAEIKYAGERVQVHWRKKDATLQFYSRSLKTVAPYKVDPLRPYLAKALASTTQAVLDAEVVLMDTQTDKPLPFGTLGKHKRKDHDHAVACLLVFDVMQLNGKLLLDKPTVERRKLLFQNIQPIRHRVQYSDAIVVATKDTVALQRAFEFTVTHKLEGLVLKDLQLTYNPGKRHWLKLKRDHLQGMADTADLVVLGSYMGKGKQSGLHAVFLMGCYDAQDERWKTVCKVGNGFTDGELVTMQTTLQSQLNVIHGNRQAVPEWLHVHNAHVPDAVVVDPWHAPVWEIAGAEFTASPAATSGWALRFPRIHRVREDKTPKEATTYAELNALAKASAAPSQVTYTGLSK